MNGAGERAGNRITRIKEMVDIYKPTGYNYLRMIFINQRCNMIQLYNMQDISKALNCSAQYVHKIYTKGKLPKPSYMVGNSPLWNFEQLIQIIQGGGQEDD